MNKVKKKKILLASPLPPPYSGYERITQCILQSALSQKFNIIHVNTSNNREMDVRGAFDLMNLLAGLNILISLVIRLAVHRPAVANIPIARNRTGFLKYSTYILAAAVFRCRIVSRLGGDSFHVFYGHSSTLFQWYIRFVLKRIDIMIVRADRLKSQFDGLIDSSRLRTVYLGCDFKETDAVASEDGRLPSDGRPRETVNVLFLGYISKAKGALDLLESVKTVAKKNQRVRFVFAGPLIKQEKNILHINNPVDTEAEVARLLKKNACRDVVRFVGEVTGSRKTAVFRDADIFVSPSYSEGFPFVALEAMAAGLPLITTRVGALPEVLQDGKNVLFVKTGSPDDLTEKILRLAEDRYLRKNMGNANRQLAETKFSLAVFADRMEKIYNEV